MSERLTAEKALERLYEAATDTPAQPNNADELRETVARRLRTDPEPVAWMVDCDGKCDLDPTVETERPEEMKLYECGICGRGPEQMTVTPLYRDPEPDDPEGLVEAAEEAWELMESAGMAENGPNEHPVAVRLGRALRDRLKEADDGAD